MIVAKFGGTSVSTEKNIATICSVVRKQAQRRPILVVSAVQGITDILLRIARCTTDDVTLDIQAIVAIHSNLIRNMFTEKIRTQIDEYMQDCLHEIKNIIKQYLAQKEKEDAIIIIGEKISAYIITEALLANRIAAQQIIATELIVTNDEFGAAEFRPGLTSKRTKKILLPLIKKNIVPVITGFIGATIDGRITTLGRGGSDYSAAIIGYALPAEEIQIWTDVNGIYSTDPRMVKSAKHLKNISYREASEMAMFGAKVLHPRTIRPAISKGIPVRIKNTFSPENIGTLIQKDTNTFSQIKAIACKKNVPIVNIYSTEMLLTKGFLMKIFSIFSKYNISVDLVSVSEVSVSVTLDNDDNITEAIEELSLFTTVTYIVNNGIVSLIGERITSTPHILKDLFTFLDTKGIQTTMISYGASDINISIVVPSHSIVDTVQLLHRRFLQN